jgi:hypothetical protein
MNRYLLLLSVAVLMLTDGYLCGRWTGRWQESPELPEAERLKELPMTVGDWQAASQELDAKVVQRAGFSGYVARNYKNQRTHAVVSFLLAWGRPGPLAVHTPEVCYGGQGYAPSNVAERCKPYDEGGSTTGELWKSTFVSKNPAVPEPIRVIWSWNKKGVWQAPDYPRWTLAGTPVLYKLYASQKYLPHEPATDAQDVEDFLREMLPQVDRALAPGS